MPNLKLDDGEMLHYLDVGRGSKTCLLIHGFGMQAEVWLPIIAPLLTKYRFVLPSLRGWGGSHNAKINNDCVATQYADDIAALISHLQLDDFVLSGYSMGAVTAMQLQKQGGFSGARAYLHIDQSPRIINQQHWPWGLMGENQPQYLQQWSEMLQVIEPDSQRLFADIPKSTRQLIWNALSGFMGETFHKKLFRGAAMPLVKQDAIMRRVLPTQNWQAYIACMRAYVDQGYDFISSMRSLSVPMTVFAGVESTMYPLAGQYAFCKEVENSKVIEFKRCGHGLPFEAPLRFAKELRKVLDESFR